MDKLELSELALDAGYIHTDEFYYKDKDAVWKMVNKVQERLNDDAPLIKGEASYLQGMLRVLEWILDSENNELPDISAPKRSK